MKKKHEILKLYNVFEHTSVNRKKQHTFISSVQNEQKKHNRKMGKKSRSNNGSVPTNGALVRC